MKLALHSDELSYEIEFGMVPISDRPHDVALAGSGSAKVYGDESEYGEQDEENEESDETDETDDTDETDEEVGPMPREDADSDALSMFRSDPDIKVEHVYMMNRNKKVSLLDRKRGSITARNMDGRNVAYPGTIAPCESVLSELRDPHKFPELSLLRTELGAWRFYHEFRTDLSSPLRQPQLATMTPVMSDDGKDMAAALATIRAMGNGKQDIDKAIREAFPGSQLSIGCSDNELTINLFMPGVDRALNACEFSDGTLKYLCLLAALLTPRPAPFVVLNEPETSIHHDLLASLSKMILDAGERSQILLTTHSIELAGLLKKSNAQIIELEKVAGATRLRRGGESVGTD